MLQGLLCQRRLQDIEVTASLRPLMILLLLLQIRELARLKPLRVWLYFGVTGATLGIKVAGTCVPIQLQISITYN